MVEVCFCLDYTKLCMFHGDNTGSILMENEQTSTTDTQGTQTDTPVETPTKTPSQILKEENDSLEAELIRAQKIRNESLLAGTSGGRVEPKVLEETPKDYADRVMKNEVAK